MRNTIVFLDQIQVIPVFDGNTKAHNSMATMLTSTRLGLIACRYLAKAYYSQKWVTAPELATHYNVNVRALTPALRGLSKAGILHSQVGGRTPGFFFAKDPALITVNDVMGALEEKYNAPCCSEIIGGLNCDCGNMKSCRLRTLFDDVLEEAYGRLKNVSIAQYAEIE